MSAVSTFGLKIREVLLVQNCYQQQSRDQIATLNAREVENVHPGDDRDVHFVDEPIGL